MDVLALNPFKLCLVIAFLLGGCAPVSLEIDSDSATPSLAPASTSPTSIPISSTATAHPDNPVPNTTILYSRACGLYSLPPLPALDKPEMRTLYKGLANCEDFGAFLVSYAPIPSPDNTHLLVTGPYETWLVNLETEDLRKLFSSKVAATWSPASDAVTYVIDERLYRLDRAVDAEPKLLFQQSGLVPLFARWSPDGKWIAVASINQSEGNAEPTLTLWIVSAAGGSAHNLGAIPAPAREWVPQDMQWSPDNQIIGTSFGWFVSLDGTKRAVADLETVSWWESAQARKLIANQVDPKWAFSYDGRRLAWLEPQAGRFQIVTFDTSTQARTEIGTLTAPYGLMVRWSADDQWIVADAGGTIWKIAARPNSVAETVLENAILIDTFLKTSACGVG